MRGLPQPCRHRKINHLRRWPCVLGRDDGLYQEVECRESIMARFVIATQIVAGPLEVQAGGGKVAFH